ncbi:hypothetical protein Ac2012v2_004763 [Leucoagaricus gongylophorus]
MEASLQFIIESPQHSVNPNKRTRLVTSCDSCRLKKIKCSQSSESKCLQPSSDTRCKACKASKIPCSFKDRERYFAERSRVMAGRHINSNSVPSQRTNSRRSIDVFTSSGSSSPSSSLSHSRSSCHSPKEILDNCRYTPYSADSRRQADYPRQSSMSGYHSRNSSMGYNNIPMNPRYIQLFDSEHPQHPHPTLMPHFFQSFFDQYASEFTFLTYDETLRKFWEQRLCPTLSNCIAAMAVRYVSIPELIVRGLQEVAETYVENAKDILSSVSQMPSMDRLHALLLLSWLEYKNDRTSSFRHYCQLATRMAMHLGLSDQSPPSHLPEGERNCRRATWANILQLHLTSSSR